MATRIDLVEDVLPISELRLRAAQQIDKIKKTRRPLVITQYGKAVAVLMEVGQFQSWQDRLTLLEEKLSRLEKELDEREPRPEEPDDEPDDEDDDDEDDETRPTASTKKRNKCAKPRQKRREGKRGDDSG